MQKQFKESKTKENIMRAFAGESQARNRYTFAADEAKAQELYAVEAVFRFTADQEKEHAEVFYGLLKEFSGENITVDGDYPVNLSASVAELLRLAEEGELAEYREVYQSFGDIAKDEGFAAIANTFYNIAAIEKTHADRFSALASLLENEKLFVSDAECEWVCLNCGHTLSSTTAPAVCPVCSHPRGFFVRLEFAPWSQK